MILCAKNVFVSAREKSKPRKETHSRATFLHILHSPERTEPTIIRIAPYAILECSDRPCDLQPVFPAWLRATV